MSTPRALAGVDGGTTGEALSVAHARELASRDDWRAAVEALGLPAREARALRVAILRERVFVATARYQTRAAK